MFIVHNDFYSNAGNALFFTVVISVNYKKWILKGKKWLFKSFYKKSTILIVHYSVSVQPTNQSINQSITINCLSTPVLFFVQNNFVLIFPFRDVIISVHLYNGKEKLVLAFLSFLKWIWIVVEFSYQWAMEQVIWLTFFFLSIHNTYTTQRDTHFKFCS